MTPGEISAATALPTSTTTRVIDRLEKRLGPPQSDPDDRRKVVIEPIHARLDDFQDAYATIVEELRVLNSRFHARRTRRGRPLPRDDGLSTIMDSRRT